MAVLSPAASAAADAASPEVLRFLLDHQADAVDHPGGTLLTHLLRTGRLLAEWGCAMPLVRAGMTIAAYGTDGMPRGLIEPTQRHVLRAAIGAEAEAIVYLYAAADRRVTWADVAGGEPASYRDRFTELSRQLSAQEEADYWALTAANELDLVGRFQTLDDISPLLRANAERLPPAVQELLTGNRDKP